MVFLIFVDAVELACLIHWENIGRLASLCSLTVRVCINVPPPPTPTGTTSLACGLAGI